MRKILIKILCWLLKIRSLDLKIEDYDKTTTEYIDELLKKRGFVTLNKKGEYLRNGFILIRLHREKEIIHRIEIKHDIDSTVNKEAIWTEINCKVTDTDAYIQYFSRI